MFRGLLNETRRNLEGKEYLLFNSNNREKDVAMFEEMFDRYVFALSNIMKNRTTSEIVTDIKNVFNSLSYIRVDESDMKTRPMLFSVSEFIHHSMNGATQRDKMLLAEQTVLSHPLLTKHLINRTKMNATTRAAEVRDGIGIFAPVIKATQNNSLSIQGKKIFMHEFLHASSAWKKMDANGREIYYQGINAYNERGVYDDLNEGMNEYFTMKVMGKMYPNEKIECGYKGRVNMVEKMMKGFSEKEQEQIFENYITGKGQKVLDIFATKKDEMGKSVVDYLDYYRAHGVGLEGGKSCIKDKELPLFGEAINDCFKSKSEDLGRVF